MLFLNLNCKSVIFHCYPEANHSRSFTIDIILIYDVEMSKMLRQISVEEYFKNRNTISRENQYAIDITSIDVVPGVSYMPIKVVPKSNKIIVDWIIFCSFSSVLEKIPRKVIGSDIEDLTVILTKEGAMLVKE